MLYLRLRRLIAFRLGREGLSLLLIATLLVLAAPTAALAAEPSYGQGNAGCGTTHHVLAGETLTQIAAHFGLDVETLAKANGLKDADVIFEDQKLCVPDHGRQDDKGYGYGMNKDGYSPQDDKGYGYGMNEDGYSPRRQDDKGYGMNKDGYSPQDDKGYGYDMSEEEYNRKMYGHVEWSYPYEGKEQRDKGYGYNDYAGPKYQDGYEYGPDRYGQDGYRKGPSNQPYGR